VFVLYILIGFILFFLLLSLFFTYFVHQIPRNPVVDPPNWGKITDTHITSIDGGYLEVWRIEPDLPSKGTILFAHGWGRNRDRMVKRARIFAEWGYTAVIHSARDHGRSSPKKLMNAIRFSEDIEAVLNWIDEPVYLYGHSAGAAASVIVAHGKADRVKLLFLDACFANTHEALLSLYRSHNKFFGLIFGPMILLWMRLFFGKQIDATHPEKLSSKLKVPVMILHGDKDTKFPLSMAIALKNSFLAEQVVDFYIAEGMEHGEASGGAGYHSAVKAFLKRYG